MNTMEYQTSSQPTITLTMALGDVRVTGWEKAAVKIASESEDVTLLESSPDQVQIQAMGDCTLYVPHGAALELGEVAGEVRLKQVQGEVRASAIHGALIARKAGSLHIATVSGDVTAKQVAGDVVIGQIMGDAAFRDVSGPVQAPQVMGDGYVRAVDGSVTLVCMGDLVARLALQAGREYRLSAQGDLSCRVLPNSSAAVTLEWQGELDTDYIDLPDMDESVPGALTLTLGAGEATAYLKAMGRLEFVTRGSGGEGEGEEDVMSDWAGVPDLSNLGETIRHQVLSALSASGIPVQGGRMADLENRVQERIDRAMERVGRDTERAARKAEREARKAERRADRATERGSRRPHFVVSPTPPRPPMPPMAPRSPQRTNEPIAHEERLKILQMLGEKKISLAEAELLLRALEGED